MLSTMVDGRLQQQKLNKGIAKQNVAKLDRNLSMAIDKWKQQLKFEFGLVTNHIRRS